MHLFWMIFSRTELRIYISRAKNCEESDSDVHFCVAPPKPAKKVEKQFLFLTEKSQKKCFDVEKLNIGNRLKRVLAKCRGRRSYVWVVNGRSKFDVIADKINLNLVSYYRRYCYYRRHDCFYLEKLNVGNRLKRVLAKCRGRTSYVWGANGRSKFDVVAEKNNFNLVSYYWRYCYYWR